MAYLSGDEQRSKISSLNLDAVAKNTITSEDSLIEELARIRKRGYSIDNEEFISGVIAISVPILDDDRRMIAGVAVTAPTARMSIDTAKQQLPALREAADDLRNYLIPG